eukprot:TRINITY_DN22201_c0_g1_i1.p1 TRINITY_DN22201_c0_g1~~TRINITY_DN22201_c0_g1_i1.p1  ORF type:complete len:155 (+),score=30.87 TRINITY_DN22201_c0_g1_i1:65-529(+)
MLSTIMQVWRGLASWYVGLLTSTCFSIGGFDITGFMMLGLGIVTANLIFYVMLKQSDQGGCVDDGRQCTARHILVDAEDAAKKALARLKKGEDFKKVAQEVSTCPSAPLGGIMGTVKPGMGFLGKSREALEKDSSSDRCKPCADCRDQSTHAPM